VDAKTTVTNDVWYGLNQPGIADENCLPDGDGIYLCPMLHSSLQGRWPDGWEGTHVQRVHLDYTTGRSQEGWSWNGNPPNLLKETVGGNYFPLDQIEVDPNLDQGRLRPVTLRMCNGNENRATDCTEVTVAATFTGVGEPKVVVHDPEVTRKGRCRTTVQETVTSRVARVELTVDGRVFDAGDPTSDPYASKNYLGKVEVTTTKVCRRR
jgi:hypothetical protein